MNAPAKPTVASVAEQVADLQVQLSQGLAAATDQQDTLRHSLVELEDTLDALDERLGQQPPGAPGCSVQVALARVMAELPSIGKSDTAPANMGGYAYRGIELITRHLQPLLARHGVVILPNVVSCDIVHSPGSDEKWQDTHLLVRWDVYGPDGSMVQAHTWGIGRDHTDKGANKAQTQAYKYLLMHLFCIADGKDDADGVDTSAAHGPTYSRVDMDAAATLYAELRQHKGTPVADAMKAWAKQLDGSLMENALRSPEWRADVSAQLALELERAATVAAQDAPQQPEAPLVPDEVTGPGEQGTLPDDDYPDSGY